MLDQSALFLAPFFFISRGVVDKTQFPLPRNRSRRTNRGQTVAKPVDKSLGIPLEADYNVAETWGEAH